MVKERALRADAERNRRRILDVAQRVFAADGLAVPIDEIARRAGLGVGTLYRHFPTKEALFAAIVVTRMEDVVSTARSLLDADAPGEAFFGFLAQLTEGWAAKKDLVDALASASVDLQNVARVKRELHVELDKLLQRAQRAGSVRGDVSVGEILALLTGTFASLDRHGAPIKGRERILAIVFDGLRAPQKANAPARKRAPVQRT